MSNLYEKIQEYVSVWRDAGYPHAQYDAIGEILEYALNSETGTLRYLRAAQLRALETYWYLRLVEGTPHIFDLYQRYYQGMDLLDALGMGTQAIKNFVLAQMMSGGGMEILWDAVKEDSAFIKKHKLQAVHETLTLAYPSYILALAMGTGKTMLIGSIIATEFALALEYHPNDEGLFIQNALVFAPGLTILQSLRDLAEVDYAKILPPRLYRAFDSSYKLTFTQDGQKDLPVIRGSRYNLIVSNTEKIRIQKRSVRRHKTWSDLQYKLKLEIAEETANLRLQAIASLPNLGVFSDEAHHTYGKSVGQRLKRVRQTVDYLHDKTNLVCVVNTTGTPYFGRQPLRDVIIWYGLSQGIRDNILKSVEDSIYAYQLDDPAAFIRMVVGDFFETYGEVALPNGAPAKLALYFPQNKDLNDLRPVVEQTLLEMDYPLDIVLRNTNQSSQDELRAFERLNQPQARHRVILLVNKGTEGWNCPSLFACALARQLRSSNNFVLQASTRCLRQIPGNPHKARIYLTMENQGVLDRQLQETYGETIASLNRAEGNTRSATLVLRKVNVPPLTVRKTIKKIVPVDGQQPLSLQLTRPAAPANTVVVQQVLRLEEQAHTTSVLTEVGETEIHLETDGPDVYTAATQLAAVYRLPVRDLYRELARLYGRDQLVPDNHLLDLTAQIEAQTPRYEVQEEEVEIALALIKPEGFTCTVEGDTVTYTTEIVYQVGREEYLLHADDAASFNPQGFGFHYDPYNFDSNPEKDFFTRMLRMLDTQPDEVEDIYFTGGISDPNKTDFYVEYQAPNGKWRRYTPDFIVRRKDRRCYIVEIKQERMRDDQIDGQDGAKAIAMRAWVGLNADKLAYEMLFTPSGHIAYNQLGPVREFVESVSGKRDGA